MLKYGRNEKCRFACLLITNDISSFGASLFYSWESLHNICKFLVNFFNERIVSYLDDSNATDF